METHDLTSRQREIYEFIVKKIDAHGYPPTIRDIGTAFEIKSPNGVMCHLKALEKKGFITRKDNSARAIQLNRRVNNRPVPQIGIPFKGLVAAGEPLPATEQEDRLDLHAMLGGSDRFALQVQGTSMIENHIDDGDYVIIRNQETARNGDRVVAMVEGEYTLKKFFRADDHIRLEPANGSMQPIILDANCDVRIVGVLVGVVRRC